MPDDQLPPIGERETLPEIPPVNDTTPPPPPDPDTDVEAELVPPLEAVPSGWARFELERTALRVERSLSRLSEDLGAMIALADAFARSLDATVSKPEAPR